MNDEILIELGVVSTETKGIETDFETESVLVCDNKKNPADPC